MIQMPVLYLGNYSPSLQIWQAFGNKKPNSLRIIEQDMWTMLFGIALHGSPVEETLLACIQKCIKLLKEEEVSGRDAPWFSLGVSFGLLQCDS